MIKISISQGLTAVTFEADASEKTMKEIMAGAFDMFTQVQKSTPQIPFVHESEINVDGIKIDESQLTQEEIDMIEDRKLRQTPEKDEMAQAQIDIANIELKKAKDAEAKKKAEEAELAAKQKEADDAEEEERKARAKARKRRRVIRELDAEDGGLSQAQIEEQSRDEEEEVADQIATEAYLAKYAEKPVSQKAPEAKTEKPAATKVNEPVKVPEPKKVVEQEPTKTPSEESTGEGGIESASEKAEKLLAAQKKDKSSLDKVIKDVIKLYKEEGTFTTNRDICEFVLAQHEKREDMWSLLCKRPDTLSAKFGISVADAKEIAKEYLRNK